MTDDPMRTSWHLAALSTDVGRTPISRMIDGTPVALYRADGGIAAMVDRCPHRNFPLSKGRVAGDAITCPYHGWTFARDGSCASVPGCNVTPDAAARLAARPVSVLERDGSVFVLLEGDAAFPELRHPFAEPGFDHFWWDQGEWRTTVFDAIENVMDPFHTSELHHGHIRRRDVRSPVSITVENFERAVEMTIHQTEPDRGFMARMFERDRSRSRSRYDAPTRFQGIWEGSRGVTISVSVWFTPVEKGVIRPIACFTTPKGFFPGWFKSRVMKGFIGPVVKQDRHALESQADTVARFGTTRYAQGPGDPLGNRVRRLLDGHALAPGVTDAFDATL